MDYVPSRTWCGNQVYLLSALFAHNLTRELQIHAGTGAFDPAKPSLWE